MNEDSKLAQRLRSGSRRQERSNLAAPDTAPRAVVHIPSMKPDEDAYVDVWIPTGLASPNTAVCFELVDDDLTGDIFIGDPIVFRQGIVRMHFSNIGLRPTPECDCVVQFRPLERRSALPQVKVDLSEVKF